MIDALPLLLGPEGYQISRSVRLRSSASAYFSRTPATASNRKTWTWSGWIKRGTLSTNQILFGSTGGSTSQGGIRLLSTNCIDVYDFNGASDVYTIDTTSLYRDVSAWYHIVVAMDTTQATASNRTKIYVNGVQITSFSTANYPTLNLDTYVNNTTAAGIGANFPGSWSQFFDGYMTEVNFIDGQALTPSSFGQTNTVTGVWQPIKYTGTYGTNGFYLNFSDNSAATAAAIGKDYSGNGNNWTPNNISVTAGATYDSMIDVPTMWADGGNGRGNYATLNPLKTTGVAGTYSNANLTGSLSTDGTIFGTIAVSSGKWYWEITPTSAPSGSTTNNVIGVSKIEATTAYAGNTTDGFVYRIDGNKYTNSTASAYGASWALNDNIGVALDMDAGTVAFYKNGVSQGTAFTGLSGNFAPVVANGNTTSVKTWDANFGQRPFTYTPPTGFKALNTQNLPTPTISNGATVMAASTYTGNGGTQSITNTVNGVSFKPDFVWIKIRSSAFNHWLNDSVRGVGVNLISNLTNAEGFNANSLSSFNSNGFSIGSAPEVNTNGGSLVAWQWQAGQGSTSSNTSGSITSTVSVNATAGFSIVTYTGTGANATVGHGLGVAPKMIIVKNRSAVSSWMIAVDYSGFTWSSDYFQFDTGAKYTNGASTIFRQAPTSTVFSVGTNSNINGSTNNLVAYCFSAVAGYSAFGSYTGNGSTDGPFVYCGFRPRWVMVKYAGGVGDWSMVDTSRNTYNVADARLDANLSSAELVLQMIDVTSNGFKVRTTNTNWNTSSGTIIFAAFAENPFKYSLAR